MKRIGRKRIGRGVLLAALVGGLASCSSVESDPVESTSDSVEFDMENVKMAGSARLIRTQDSISVSGEMAMVEEGQAYTMWWVIFNSPENCTGANSPTPETGAFCGMGDFDASQLEPAGTAWGLCDGFVGSEGGTFSCTRSISDGDTDFELSGITDPMNAEIHMILRTHGPALQGAMLDAQLTSYMGGCEEGDPFAADCEELSYVPFLPNVEACIPLHGRECP